MKIKFNNIFIVLFFILYLKPFNTSFWGVIDTFLQLAKIVISFILLVLILIKDKPISKITLYAVMFLLAWSIALIINSTLTENFISIISIACIFLFIDLYRGNSKDEKYIFKCLYIISSIYIILHTLTIFMGHPIFGEAVNYDRYFLGGDNRSAFILLILCALIYIYDVKYKKSIAVKTVIISLIGLAGLIYTFSVAGLISYSFLLLAILLRKHKIVKTVFSVKCVLVLMAVVVISVAVFHIEDKLQPVLSLFGKNGLSSRETIWPLAIQHFWERKLFGYGALSAEQISKYYLYGAGHTHNLILELLMMTGIVGSVLFFILLYKVINKCKRVETLKTYYIFMFGLTSYFLCAIFDFYIELIYLYLFLGLMTLGKEKRLERHV